MVDSRIKEEVLNVILAQILGEMGIVSLPEQLTVLPDLSRRIPDVLMECQGLRTIIEGKIDDTPNAKKIVFQQAANRVYEGLAHIGIAVIYPSILRGSFSIEALKAEMSEAFLNVAIISEAGEQKWVRCKIEGLVENIRRTYDRLLKEDIIGEITALIEAGVNRFADTLSGHFEVIERSAELIGMRKEVDEEGIISKLSPKQRVSVSKIAGLSIFNAMVFQDILSDYESRVLTLRKTIDNDDPISSLVILWKFVLEEIDYVPIFKVARNLLLALPANPDILNAVRYLAEQGIQVLNKRAALHHDVMGRVYHKLLADAKYLATYYTSVPAATLLLKIAFARKLWKTDWSANTEIESFRIADLACGTGTLLVAAAEAYTDNFVITCFNKNEKPDLLSLHRLLMENVLHGYDVLPSALQLTASTLALRTSCTTFKDTNLYCLPLGGSEHRLGSIEFLEGNQVPIPLDIFRTDTIQVTGEGEKAHLTAPLPKLDLCVMNPPFTRSDGGNLLFGHSPDAERGEMQNKLRQLIRRNGVLANSSAGLGAIFIAIGDTTLKVGGRIAYVLPKTLLSGVAWKKTRDLLKKHYRLEYIVVSHDPHRWNFSDSTNLSELLLVAQKTSDNNNNSINDREVTFVNLWRNPKTVFEALAVAWEIIESEASDIATGQGALEFKMGDRKLGEALSIPWSDIRNDNWMIPSAFAQNDLIRAAYYLTKGKLYLRGSVISGKIPICKLSEFGRLGPDRSAIHGGFTVSNTRSIYPTFWGHDSKTCLTIAQKPNKYLAPRSKAKNGRYLSDTKKLWDKSSRLLITEGIRLNTHRLVSIITDEDVLSNVWWSIETSMNDESKIKALTIWLNSTLGFITMLIHRGETEGAWIGFKKTNLEVMPILDVKALDEVQISILADTYDDICNEVILPFPEMENDPIREKIDSAIAEALGLPDYSVLRMLLAQEPVVCLKGLGS